MIFAPIVAHNGGLNARNAETLPYPYIINFAENVEAKTLTMTLGVNKQVPIVFDGNTINSHNLQKKAFQV